LFSSFNRTLSDKQSTYQSQLTQIETLEKVQKELLEKKALVQSFGGAQTNYFSMISEKIAQTIPAHIKLKQLEVFPKTKKKTFEETFNFNQNELIIKGIISQSSFLAAWISRLKTLEDISQIDLIEITEDADKGHSVFVLRIKLEQHEV
jgi:Tfp pilus assembly protein PilN